MAETQNNEEFLNSLMGEQEKTEPPKSESFFFRSLSRFGIGFYITLRGKDHRIGIGWSESTR